LIPRKALFLIRYRTLVPRIVYNRDNIQNRPIPKPAVSRLRKGTTVFRAGNPARRRWKNGIKKSLLLSVCGAGNRERIRLTLNNVNSKCR
jgi:hypothetical protein